MDINLSGDLMEAVLIKRINRFIAQIEVNGHVENAHVPNTGRMAEFMIPGSKIIVRHILQSHRKTKYDLLMVYQGEVLINIDSKLPNILLYELIKSNKFPPYKNCNHIKREVGYKNSRFDLAFEKEGQLYLLEAKCATLVKEGGLATFPDAPTERGTKHITELIDAYKNGYRGGVVFIVQREDAHSFTPNLNMDKAFAYQLKKAYDTGIDVHAYNCKVNKTGISLGNPLDIYWD